MEGHLKSCFNLLFFPSALCCGRDPLLLCESLPAIVALTCWRRPKGKKRKVMERSEVISVLAWCSIKSLCKASKDSNIIYNIYYIFLYEFQ